MQLPPEMESWTQPTTAPSQPEIDGDPSDGAGIGVDRGRWVEDPPVARSRPAVRPPRPAGIDVLSGIVVIGLLLAVLVALTLLLLGKL